MCHARCDLISVALPCRIGRNREIEQNMCAIILGGFRLLFLCQFIAFNSRRVIQGNFPCRAKGGNNEMKANLSVA